MNHPVCNALRRGEYFLRPLRYWLAPALSALLALLVIRGAVTVQLPEAVAEYEVFFLILAFLFSGFFLLICLPCVGFSCYLSLQTLRRKQSIVLPVLQLLLNGGLLLCWVWALKQLLF